MADSFGQFLKNITNKARARAQDKEYKKYIQTRYIAIIEGCTLQAEKGKYSFILVDNAKCPEIGQFISENGLMAKYTHYPCGCAGIEDCGGREGCRWKCWIIDWETSNNSEAALYKKLTAITKQALEYAANVEVQKNIEKIKTMCEAAANAGNSTVTIVMPGHSSGYDIFLNHNGIVYEIALINGQCEYKLSW